MYSPLSIENKDLVWCFVNSKNLGASGAVEGGAIPMARASGYSDSLPTRIPILSLTFVPTGEALFTRRQ